MLQITRKTGMDGRLFGSVTNIDIADALLRTGLTVERSAIRLPEGPLKAIGDAAIEIALHTDVVAKITVSVLGVSTKIPSSSLCHAGLMSGVICQTKNELFSKRGSSFFIFIASITDMTDCIIER
jgi:hypothetical protein